MSEQEYCTASLSYAESLDYEPREVVIQNGRKAELAFDFLQDCHQVRVFD